MPSRSKRRQDGSLRPSVARARARKRGEGYLAPDIVARFRSMTVPGSLVWNAHEDRERLDLDVAALGGLLERLAGEHRWAKLRDTAGAVRAIGLPRNHPSRADLEPRDHRAVMLARLETLDRLEA